MGLFSFLCDIGSSIVSLGKDVVKAVGEGVGTTLSAIGNATGIGIIEDVGDFLVDICGETSSEVGATRSYDPNTSSVHETINISQILTNFTNQLNQTMSAVEGDVKTNINAFFDKFYRELQNEEDLKSVANILLTSKNITVNSIDGVFNEVCSRRASLSDKECLDILKMSEGQKKKEKMEEFEKIIINEGLDAISSKLGEAIKDICNSIERELGGVAQQKTQNAQATNEQVKKAIKEFQSNTANREAGALPIAKKLVAINIALELMQGA